MKELVPRFKEIRKKLHMSQQEFADYLTNDCNVKTAKATIGRYEAGLVYPSKQTLEKYSKALNVTSYYLSGKGPNKKDIPNKIISILRNSYFQQRNPVEVELRQDSQLWISFYQQMQLAQAYEIGDTKRIKLIMAKNEFADANDELFWEEYFHFLLTNNNLIDSLVGTTDEEFVSLIDKAIKKHYNDAALSNTLDVLMAESAAITRKTSELVTGIRNKEASKDELVDMIDSEIKRLESLKRSIKNSNDF